MDEKILELALKELSKAFNDFISECMDDSNKPKQPTIQALMKARGFLPPYCDKALQSPKGSF